MLLNARSFILPNVEHTSLLCLRIVLQACLQNAMTRGLDIPDVEQIFAGTSIQP